MLYRPDHDLSSTAHIGGAAPADFDEVTPQVCKSPTAAGAKAT